MTEVAELLSLLKELEKDKKSIHTNNDFLRNIIIILSHCTYCLSRQTEKGNNYLVSVRVRI